MTLVNKLTAIGDAIREKTGGTAELTLDQMVTEIGGITGGGGEVDTTVEDAYVTGTLTSYTNHTLTKVGRCGFANQFNLQTVDLPKVTRLEAFAFQTCRKLTSVNLPLVGSASVNCFQGCITLETISLPSATVINEMGLSGCNKLNNVHLPNVNSVAQTGFQGCISLEKLELPSLTKLGFNAFSGCSNLTTLIIRNTTSVANMTGAAFTNTPISKGTGYIYVPDELVETYKISTNWATYANQIKPLSEYVEVS